MAQQPSDPVASLLRRQPLTAAQRADLWDLYTSASDVNDLATRLETFQAPKQVKAALWDLKADSTPETDSSWADLITSALPTVGGIVGGVVGAAGGTVAGVGVGGVPGAIGGATLGGAAGESAKQLANRLRGKWAPGTMGEAARQIATEGAVQGASELVGAGVAKAATGTARAVYRGYLKPALSERLAPKAEQIVETALAEALPISRSGVATGRAVINDLKAEVGQILTRSGGTVDLKVIADEVRKFARSKYYKPGVDAGDFDAAMAVANKIDNHPSLGIPPGATPTRVSVPAPAANQVKRALDDSVTEAGFGVKTGAQKTTEKMARNELRQGLEAVEPTIGPLNKRESKLIEATKAIARAVEREANQSVLHGAKTLTSAALGGGAGYYQSGDPYQAAAWALALRVGLHPAVASRAAITAYRTGRQLGVTAASAARLAVLAVSHDQEQRREQD